MEENVLFPICQATDQETLIFHEEEKNGGGKMHLSLPINNTDIKTTERLGCYHANENPFFHSSNQRKRSRRIMLNSPHDDVRSAAIALTSLSLSPANLLKTNDGKADLSKKHFAFPPHNTPTDEYSNKTYTRYVPTITINNESRELSNELVELTQKQEDEPVPLISPRYSRSDGLCSDPDSFLPFKPRSYSTNRDFQLHQTDRISKQRSYSFDAVGRAHKYVPGYCTKKDPEILIGQCGHHSPPRHHRDSTGSDEGIGSSGGSADSMETLPYKRKLHRTVFRCMWRGCEKELTTLSGIILHVRHEHIGPSRAGEEEFYFDDVNVDSRTTSGVSSNSSNESLVEIPTKETINNISDDQNRSETINIPSFIALPTFSSLDTSFVNSRHVSIQPLIEPPVHLPYTLTNIDSSACKKAKPVLEIHQPHIIATTLNSPNFNMDFSNVSQSYESTQQLLNNTLDKKTTTMKRRKSSGKKKCRKVYGMNNKDLWCTQCRWKKACARFL